MSTISVHTRAKQGIPLTLTLKVISWLHKTRNPNPILFYFFELMLIYLSQFLLRRFNFLLLESVSLVLSLTHVWTWVVSRVVG